MNSKRLPTPTAACCPRKNSTASQPTDRLGQGCCTGNGAAGKGASDGGRVGGDTAAGGLRPPPARPPAALAAKGPARPLRLRLQQREHCCLITHSVGSVFQPWQGTTLRASTWLRGNSLHSQLTDLCARLVRACNSASVAAPSESLSTNGAVHQQVSGRRGRFSRSIYFIKCERRS